jgi:hypothetical protein
MQDLFACARGTRLFFERAGRILLLATLPALSCAQAASGGDPPPDPGDDIATTTNLGIPDRFTANQVMSDEFFSSIDSADGDTIQAFLESTPYGTRCWLADELVGDSRASDVLAETSRRFGINPIVLLARAQVEQGVISVRARPSNSRVDFAFGCGCADGSGCASFAGLGPQIECTASTLSQLHQESINGSGQWVAGRARTTSDGILVRPANDATAALYAYTPWVLVGTGGNWLVWNITRKFAEAFENQ